MVRLRGQDSSALPILPSRTLDECASMIEENHLHYREFLDGLTEDGLNQEVAYKNSKGLEFRTSIRDILSHVAFHSTYHRGQIATIIRDAGDEPVNTDFITFVQQKGLRTGIEDLDKFIAKETQTVKGFPLKQVVTTTQKQGGKAQTSTTTMTITGIKQATVPDATFAIPSGYKQIDSPLAGVEQLMKQQ